jgi:membrane protein
MQKLIEVLKRTAGDWRHDDTGRMAASLAYYAAISIAPLLVVVIAAAGSVFGEDAARGAIMDQLDGILGRDGAATVESMIAGADKPRTGLIATAMGIGVLLFGSTGVFMELQSSMNAIWDVAPKPGGGVMAFVRHRALSLAMVLGIAFLLLVSLALSAGLTALGSALDPYIPGAPIVWKLVMFGASFLIITMLFGMIFKVLPDVNIRFRDVWIGAAFTAALFVLGKFLVGIYLEQADVATSYGAAGSVVVMLLWVYYSAHIFFFGAEFTQAYAHLHGSSWEPTRDAVPAQHRKHPERRSVPAS